MNCGAVALHEVAGISPDCAVALIMHYRRNYRPPELWEYELHEGWEGDESCVFDHELIASFRDLGWSLTLRYQRLYHYVRDFQRPGLWLLMTQDHILLCRDGMAIDGCGTFPAHLHPEANQWIEALGELKPIE